MTLSISSIITILIIFVVAQFIVKYAVEIIKGLKYWLLEVRWTDFFRYVVLRQFNVQYGMVTEEFKKEFNALDKFKESVRKLGFTGYINFPTLSRVEFNLSIENNDYIHFVDKITKDITVAQLAERILERLANVKHGYIQRIERKEDDVEMAEAELSTTDESKNNTKEVEAEIAEQDKISTFIDNVHAQINAKE